MDGHSSVKEHQPKLSSLSTFSEPGIRILAGIIPFLIVQMPKPTSNKIKTRKDTISSIQIEACLFNPTSYKRSHSKGPK